METKATTGSPNFSINNNQSFVNTYLHLRSLFLKSFNLPSLFLAVIPTEFTLAENVLHSLQSAFALNAKTPANKRFMITNLS